VLVLPIKKKWFDMIRSGEKKEEYREIKPYYDKRIGHYSTGTGKVTTLVLRNGYSYKSPSIKCKCAITIGPGKEVWGAEPNINYYVIKILEIIERRNCNG
jgi:hypothetical protein